MMRQRTSTNCTKFTDCRICRNCLDNCKDLYKAVMRTHTRTHIIEKTSDTACVFIRALVTQKYNENSMKFQWN